MVDVCPHRTSITVASITIELINHVPVSTHTTLNGDGRAERRDAGKSARHLSTTHSTPDNGVPSGRTAPQPFPHIGDYRAAFKRARSLYTSASSTDNNWVCEYVQTLRIVPQETSGACGLDDC
jgi:hypothetical protein